MSDEELQPQDAESLETTDEGTQAPEEGEEVDYKAEAAKYKAIAERKAKKLEKLETSLKEKDEKTKKTNTQSELSRDEVKLIAKNFEDEDIERAKLVAKEKGITLLEAAKDSYVQDKLKERLEKEKSEKAQLPPSKGGATVLPKDPNEMSEEEHSKAYYEAVEKAQKGQL